MRTFGIWVFGLLASAIGGGLLASLLDTNPYNSGPGNAPLGVLAGMFTFACVRLWLGQSSKNSN
jgi:hypothetical protein